MAQFVWSSKPAPSIEYSDTSISSENELDFSCADVQNGIITPSELIIIEAQLNNMEG